MWLVIVGIVAAIFVAPAGMGRAGHSGIGTFLGGLGKFGTFVASLFGAA
jgi:hypothetical protein